MTANELKRLLKSKGCTFQEGTNHTLVYFGVNSAPMPRHPSKEIKKGTLQGILTELGLKEEKIK